MMPKQTVWIHRLFGPAFVMAAHLIELAVMAGSLTAAAVVAAYGKFLAAAMLLFLAYLCVLRIRRRRLRP